MPTANRAKFVPGALDCFLAQDWQDKELIILDDGENAVPRGLIPDDERIHYFRTAPRETTGTKRNACCELSRGELICHWDDDDWSAAGRISHQVETLLAHPDARVTGFKSILYWDDAKWTGYRYRQLTSASGTSLMYSRAWWAQNRFGPRQLGEDSDFANRAKRAGVLHVEDGEKLMVVRIHPDRTSTTGISWPHFSPVARHEFPQEFWI